MPPIVRMGGNDAYCLSVSREMGRGGDATVLQHDADTRSS